MAVGEPAAGSPPMSAKTGWNRKKRQTHQTSNFEISINYVRKLKADLTVELDNGLSTVSNEEIRCVVCGKKLKGKSCKIYRNPSNEELKLCVCSDHEDYINALDTLGLLSTNFSP